MSSAAAPLDVPNEQRRTFKTWPRGLTALLAFGVALRLPFLGSPEIDRDEGVFWQSLKSMAEGHRLFGQVYSSQPPAFLLSVAPTFDLLGHSIQAARLTMVAYFVVAVIAGWFIGLRLGGKAVGVAAAALLVADPLVFRQSVTLQAEGPAIAFGLLAVALAADGRLPTSVLAGMVLSLGILTKLLDVAYGVPVLILLLMPLDRRRLVGAVAGGVAGAGAVLVPFLDVWPQVWQDSVGVHLASRHLPMGGLTGNLYSVMSRELWMVVLATGGAALAARRHLRLLATGGGLTLAGLVVAVAQHPLWPHHTIVAVTGLILLAAALGELVTPRRLTIASAALVVLATAGASSFVASRIGGGNDAAEAARLLASRTDPGRPVVSDDPFTVALAGRSMPPDLVDTSGTRISSGHLSAAEVEAEIENGHTDAVMFASGDLDRLPGFPTWVAVHFPVRSELPGGRVLYTRS